MGQLSMTTTEVQNTLDARHTPFIQDIGDATHTAGDLYGKTMVIYNT